MFLCLKKKCFSNQIISLKINLNILFYSPCFLLQKFVAVIYVDYFVSRRADDLPLFCIGDEISYSTFSVFLPDVQAVGDIQVQPGGICQQT